MKARATTSTLGTEVPKESKVMERNLALRPSGREGNMSDTKELEGHHQERVVEMIPPRKRGTPDFWNTSEWR